VCRSSVRIHGRKPLALRRIAADPRLRVSACTLWRSIAVVRQHRALPPEVAGGLTWSQHRALFPVRDLRTLNWLATRAVREEAPPQTVQAWVAECCPRRTGRPPKPRLSRAFQRLDGALDELAEVLAEDARPDGAARALLALDARWRAIVGARCDPTTPVGEA
jgi:hypothetical protein